MGSRPPTPSFGARMRATGFHGRLVMDDIGTPALVIAAVLALFSVLELVVLGFALSDELTTGGDLGDGRVQLFLLAALLGAVILAGVVLGTWFRKVWVIRALVVLRLIGVVFTLAAAGTVSAFAIILLLLVGALWVIAEIRWTGSDAADA